MSEQARGAVMGEQRPVASLLAAAGLVAAGIAVARRL
jgi:hypothetical protein